MERQAFHLAIPVHELSSARAFYGGVLGCREGRSGARWVDFDFHGHQLVVHVVRGAPGAQSFAPPAAASADAASAAGASAAAGVADVDGDDVPVPHFGVLLAWDDWEALAERMRAVGVAFAIAPRVRFAGRVGEQGTFFVRDPSGNALEFKAFRDPAQLFAT
jgi:hypothetical protein